MAVRIDARGRRLPWVFWEVRRSIAVVVVCGLISSCSLCPRAPVRAVGDSAAAPLYVEARPTSSYDLFAAAYRCPR